MEIINIEKETFDLLVDKVESLTRQVDNLYAGQAENRLDGWVDNQEVCLMLNISLRTLQTLRDTGRIAFSRINHKVYYKVEDVEKILVDSTVSNTNKK